MFNSYCFVKRKYMVKKLTYWLESIFEDDPLPPEIHILLFNTVCNGNYKYLTIKGYEKEINLNAITFMPLENQFFDCLELAKLHEEVFCYRAKVIIEEAFDSKTLQNELKNVKIYFAFNNRVEYLFSV